MSMVGVVLSKDSLRPIWSCALVLMGNVLD